jgi:methionine-rich copper-binding protein CopC
VYQLAIIPGIERTKGRQVAFQLLRPETRGDAPVVRQGAAASGQRRPVVLSLDLPENPTSPRLTATVLDEAGKLVGSIPLDWRKGEERVFVQLPGNLSPGQYTIALQAGHEIARYNFQLQPDSLPTP